jgi:dTDP-4-amino-4,6-dideoxygalactose transaminase
MQIKMIPFNKPYLSGKETLYIQEAVNSGHLCGNGNFTKKCQDFFENRYNFNKCLLTSSCTDALEMASILIDIKPGDEVIMPSYTFVSTANAFVLRGAKIVFCDSKKDYPGIDESLIESLITTKTKAIVVVHYAGIACEMEKIVGISNKYNLFLIEDAAQAIDNYFINDNKKKALGSFGHLSTFSFHESKNIIAGEGGLLVINDKQFEHRAEIIWEKGTNRSSFYRGEVDKYGWVDLGSSFLPSEMTAAFLWAQLENIDRIQEKRINIWKLYYNELKDWAYNNDIEMPFTPTFSTNNAHMFYLICKNKEQRDLIISQMRSKKIDIVFHYQNLEKSKFFNEKHDGRILPESEKYTNCLIRLPLFYTLTDEEINIVITSLQSVKL